MATIKPGWKTSELWALVAQFLLTFAMLVGLIPDVAEDLVTTLLSLLAAQTGVYITGRTFLKASDQKRRNK